MVKQLYNLGLRGCPLITQSAHQPAISGARPREESRSWENHRPDSKSTPYLQPCEEPRVLAECLKWPAFLPLSPLALLLPRNPDGQPSACNPLRNSGGADGDHGMSPPHSASSQNIRDRLSIISSIKKGTSFQENVKELGAN